MYVLAGKGKLEFLEEKFQKESSFLFPLKVLVSVLLVIVYCHALSCKFLKDTNKINLKIKGLLYGLMIMISSEIGPFQGWLIPRASATFHQFTLCVDYHSNSKNHCALYRCRKKQLHDLGPVTWGTTTSFS